MIDYSIKKKSDGNLVVESSVTSGSISHVTEKEIRSFFLNLSSQSFFDTGLLPVDGTGLLAYRQAGNHAQIVVQRSPGVSRVIWGRSERDASAQVYFLAQPYQIYIGDLLEGNFYGARLFYSYNPITSPNDPLYHVNLPNINCQGYKGNGVGWVCLYHNGPSWANIPLGEKVSRLIERCSGDEAYNDANMSETDGPRFYRKHNKPEYLWNPSLWQEKTEKEGFSWVTQSDLWIPVMVEGIDNQAFHSDSPNAVHLTLGMALTGNYSAYYSDTYLPKPVNAIARNLPQFDQKHVFDILQKSYAKSALSHQHSVAHDPYTHVVQVRHQNVGNVSASSYDESEEHNEEAYYCEYCESTFEDGPLSSPDGDVLCESCFSDNFVVLENGNVVSNESATYIEKLEHWVLDSDVHVCDCETQYQSGFFHKYHWYVEEEDGENYCMECWSTVLTQEKIQQFIRICQICQRPSDLSLSDLAVKHPIIQVKSHDHIDPPVYLHKDCYHNWGTSVWTKYSPCACGHFDLSGQKSLNIYEVSNQEALQDIDPQANIYVKTSGFNPCKEVADHYGIQTNGQYPQVIIGNACVSCVKYDGNCGMVYDPSKYDIQNLPYSDLVAIWQQQIENSK